MKSKFNFFQEAVSPFLGFFFENQCYSCGGTLLTYQYGLCDVCFLLKKNIASQPHCKKCFLPLISEFSSLCDHCSKHQKWMDRLWAIYPYHDPWDRLLLDCKNKGRKKMYHYLVAKIMEHNETFLKSIFANLNSTPLLNPSETSPLSKYPIAITYIPMSPKSEKERGFHPAKAIAIELSSLFDIPCIDLLIKGKKTLAQKSLNHEQRIENVKNSFLLNDDYKETRFASMLIVDDVATTGATLEEAARVAHRLPMDKVYGFVLFRA